MHLIINSLDTRGWMSDGVSSRAVEKQGGHRVGGERGDVLQKRRSEENRDSGGRGTGME